MFDFFLLITTYFVGKLLGKEVVPDIYNYHCYVKKCHFSNIYNYHYHIRKLVSAGSYLNDDAINPSARQSSVADLSQNKSDY